MRASLRRAELNHAFHEGGDRMQRVSLPFLLLLVTLVSFLTSSAEAEESIDSLFAAPTLDLASLERAVLERNSSLAAMRAAWSAMDARADREGAWEDPRLDVMVAPGSFGSSTVDKAYSVGVTQRIPLFGERSLRGRAARAIARSSAEEYRAVRLDLLMETRRLYYQYFLAARGVETNQELTELMDQFRRVAVQKYAAGTVGQQDALQAEVELAMLEHERVALSRTRRTTMARLRALLHDESSRTLPEPPRDLPAPAHFTHADSSLAPSTALADALANRPELRAQEALRDARAAELGLARRNRIPDVTLQARYDRFMMEPEWRPMVGVGLNLPIGFRRIGAGMREARAELERATRDRGAIVDSVRAELESARVRVEETGHELRIITTRVVPATERALASTRAGYESNRSDFLALLNAQRDLARARLGRHAAETEYHMALSELDRALGVEPSWLGREERR
jgi:cobalt-zinc-cadmium efflux system outer membrane protein